MLFKVRGFIGECINLTSWQILLSGFRGIRWNKPLKQFPGLRQ